MPKSIQPAQTSNENRSTILSLPPSHRLSPSLRFHPLTPSLSLAARHVGNVASSTHASTIVVKRCSPQQVALGSKHSLAPSRHPISGFAYSPPRPHARKCHYPVQKWSTIRFGVSLIAMVNTSSWCARWRKIRRFVDFWLRIPASAPELPHAGTRSASANTLVTSVDGFLAASGKRHPRPRQNSKAPHVA
jgi:hypothetical protein